MCGTNATICVTMAKVASVFIFMVLLAVVVEGRDWRFEVLKRTKRGYNPGTFGSNSDTYGRSDENASVSRERLGCSDEQGGGSYGSGSRELAYNRDGRSSGSDNRRHSYSKASATASASATAFNQNHNINL